MKFGFPDDEIIHASPLCLPNKFVDASRPLPLLPLELLNQALQNLNLAHSQNVSQPRRLLSTLQHSIETALANLEERYQRLISDQNERALKILEHQERLRIEEEERQERLRIEEEERQQRERHEEQQRKLKQEEEARRAREAEKQAEEKKKAEAEKERRKLELQEKKRIEQEKLEKDKQSRLKKVGSDFKAIELTLLKYRQDIADIKANIVVPMEKNKDLKKQANVVKRKINVKLGQFSNSISQVRRIISEVTQLLQLIESNKPAYEWILNCLSKALVSQAEAEVTVKPTAALPLGIFAAHFLEAIPQLEYFLSARFVKKCAFVVGYSCSIDTEEGRLRMGWKRSLDGKWEQDIKYDERMGGICTFWACIGLNLKVISNTSIFGLPSQWTFVARMLNTDPSLLTNTHYVVVANWWAAAAERFLRAYGKQSYKLLQSVYSWTMYGKQKSYPTATKLELLGEDLGRRKYNTLRAMEN